MIFWVLWNRIAVTGVSLLNTEDNTIKEVDRILPYDVILELGGEGSIPKV